MIRVPSRSARTFTWCTPTGRSCIEQVDEGEEPFIVIDRPHSDALGPVWNGEAPVCNLNREATHQPFTPFAPVDMSFHL